MDSLTFLGLFLAVIAICAAQILEGGQINQLLNLPAFLIVFGGSSAAVMLQTPFSIFRRAASMFFWIFIPPKYHMELHIKQILKMSENTRKEGILSLERTAKRSKDIFFKKAIEILMDGVSVEDLRSSLNFELESEEKRDLDACHVFDSLGGYSPTIGIMGTVMGLIQVMNDLTDPTEIGTGIAVAFIATIYGVGFANLLFLPVASKLRSIVLQRTRLREMIIEGFAAMCEGEHPKTIERRLDGFIEKRK